MTSPLLSEEIIDRATKHLLEARPTLQPLKGQLRRIVGDILEFVLADIEAAILARQAKPGKRTLQ